MEKENILVVSPFCAYKTIKHAGGKIHYYYLKKLEPEFNITHISTARIDEKKDIENFGIQAKKIILYRKINKNFVQKFIENFQNYLTQRNPLDKYAGFIQYNQLHFFYKQIKELARKKFSPKYIILDWTQAIFTAKKVKKLFPKSKLICVEQDVTYLKYARFAENTNNVIKKQVQLLKYKNIKKEELKALTYADEILTLNSKDSELIKQDIKSNKKIRVIAPFFDLYSNVKRKNISDRTIIYFGAMSRPENYLTAIWTIKNILPSLESIDKLIIIGNNPDHTLSQFASDKVVITGFVNDIKPFLENSLCFVAPIVMGAGIKIKILEAMSSGIPVLTNELGIEGIPATKNQDYLFCKTKDDYIKSIILLEKDSNFASKIGENGKKFIENNFNFELDSYIKGF